MTDQQRNPAATFALLAYWRAALADSALIHPTVTADCPRIQIGADDKGRWQVTSAPKNWIETTFSTSKASKDDDEGTRKPIPLLLIPSLLVPESLHGVKRGKGDADENLVPLCIPCMLSPGGSLSVDNERLPWIPRTLLEPTYQQVTVGTLQALDDYLTQLTDRPKTLTDTFNIAAALFTQVAGQRLALLPTASGDDSPPPPLLEMAGYGVIDAWFAIPYEPPVMARHLIRLYDQLAQQANIPPLLASLTHLPDRPAKPPLPLPKTAARYKKIIGHINRKHPLSPSQHGAMVELLDLKVGELLAVNGPPGTGKTTLLQSVVAQQWVTAAINNEPCPVIAATSTNVKAVENVLDSFAKLGREIAHQRWLPDIGGFGLFLASASRTSEHPTFKSPDQHYFLPFETPEWQGKSTEYYLKQAKKMPQLASKATDVPTVVAALQKLLRNYAGCLQKIVTLRYQIFDFTSSDERIGAVTGLRNVCRECESNMILAEREIQRAQQIIDDSLEKKKEEQTRHHASLREIKQVELAWSVYLSSLPSFLLDLLSFLPPIQRWRNARDRAFLLGHALTSELPHRGDGLVEDHFSKLTRQEKLRYRSVIDELARIENAATNAHRKARNDKEKYAARLGDALALQEKWCTLLGDTFAAMSDVSLEELNDQLDISLRAPMFQLADWYWSGCWLLEMESRIRDGSKDSKSPQKLEAMLRRFAKLAPCMVSNFHMLPAFFCGWMGSQAVPLWNMIDLLIVDEAGQVSPEIGAPSFALAKRAIVVGDVHQIEPIWNVPEGVDRSNAAKYGLIPTWKDPAYLKMEEDGYTAAKGNLMQMSARACNVQQYPDTRGLLLTEHRRCVPELIAYCNELVYRGRLIPKRGALTPAQRILPAFGYYPVRGTDQKIGSSRKNVAEAHRIVDWLVENRLRLEQHYLDDKSKQPRHISQIVGIVTPFSPQAALIAGLIKKKMPDTKQKGLGITVGTVHRLQGAEREIVLFSAVYGDSHKGGMFFDKGRNMLNVAVSRARDCFLVFGNMALFNPQRTELPSGLLAKYLFEHASNDLSR